MPRGAKRSPVSKPARKVHKNTSNTDDFDGMKAAAKKKAARAKATDTTKAVGAFLASLCSDPIISKDAGQRIRDCHAQGIGVNGLAAVVMYELETMRALFQRGELREGEDESDPVVKARRANSIDAASYAVALNKVAAHAISAVSVEADRADELPSEVKITFTVQGLPQSQRREAAHGKRSAAHPVVGDVIDAE